MKTDTRTIESLDILSAAARSRMIDEGTSMRDLFRSHEGIVDAAADHDADRFREAVIAHLDLLAGLYKLVQPT